MKLSRYHSILIILIGFLLLGCKEKDQSKSDSEVTDSGANATIRITKEQFEANRMRLDTVSTRSLSELISVSGLIDVPPQSIASLSAIQGGYIKDIPFLVGDQVKKGQALVTLENPEFITLQQEFLEISERLNYLRSEYERQQTLIEENITSRKNFLKAESEFKSAVARHEGLRKRLLMLSISPKQVEAGNISATTRLYAPIEGSISEVHVTKGMYVSPTTEILEIINTDHIHLELNVFEKDILKLRKGQEIRFQIPEISGDTYTGEVYLIGTDIDQNRTIKVHGHLKNDAEVQFLRGMFLEAQILVGRVGADPRKTLALPENAIVEIEDRHYILQLESQDDQGYVFQKVEVQLGQASGGIVEILSENLSPQDQVLVRGAYEAMPQ